MDQSRNSGFSFGLKGIILCALIGLSQMWPSPIKATAQIDTLWIETWEEPNWPLRWSVQAGTWEVGTPTSGPDSSFFGENCAATVLGGIYAEPVDSRLIRKEFFVVPDSSQNPRLRFWHWYSFGGGDFGRVEISTDGVQWKPLSVDYTASGSNVWTYTSIDLSAYSDSTVQIAFYLHTLDCCFGDDRGPGWYIDDIVVIKGDFIIDNPENFEKNGIGDWAAERGTWEVGKPTSGPGSALQGENCAATVLSGNYAEPVDSRLTCPPFVIPSADKKPTLLFWHWYSFGGGDYGEVQLRVLNGSTWHAISDRFTSSSSGVWSPHSIDLSAYSDSTVQIGFFFHSVDCCFGDDRGSGWYIDSVAVLPDRPTDVDFSEGGLPLTLALHQNYPNPFNPETTIHYQVNKADFVELTIYNTRGQMIRRLVHQHQTPGEYQVQWDGKDEAGQVVASGVYLYRLQSREFIQTRKMILVR